MLFRPIAGLLVLLATILALAASAVAAGVGGGAVVFVYGRFDEDRTPGSSLRIDQFEDHLDELKDGDYRVLPLPFVVDALRTGGALPDRTVSITIDEASQSFYTEAWPRLRAAGLPFTLFVATDAIDRGLPGAMSWAQLRELLKAGVTIGALSASAQPMAALSSREIRDDLDRMKQRFTAELGVVPTLFAYPRGEYSVAVRKQIEQAGFLAAFGQQSGVAYAGSDPFALPRFLMNDAFGSLDRFELAANALPLPVTDITPDDPVLTRNPPLLGFTVPDGLGNLDRLACFATGQGRTGLERIGGNRIEVRIADAFPPGRARVNCTLPTDDDRWRWFGIQFFIPEAYPAGQRSGGP
ncbi:MAG: polysaccharide deacetylase family protein [Rhodospirillaceae bacterium]